MRTSFSDVAYGPIGGVFVPAPVRVSVFSRDTVALAPAIYAASTGGGPIGNPFTVAAGAEFKFWIDPGQWDVLVEHNAVPKLFGDRTINFDAVPGDDIPGGMILADSVSSTEAMSTEILAPVGLNETGVFRRRVQNTGTIGTRTDPAYGQLDDLPDQVAGIVLPVDGLIVVSYQAVWKETVLGAARAALFLNNNQVTVAPPGNVSASPRFVDSGVVVANAVNQFTPLGLPVTAYSSDPPAPAGAYTGDSTTGQLLGVGLPINPGVVYIFAVAGTYTVAVRFKSSSGTISAQSRKLRVWTVGF